MDLLDATKVLLDRIQKLEPELATKIMGYILMQGHKEREMIRLACAPEKLIEDLVQKAKLQLGYLSKPPVSTSISTSIANAINPSPISNVFLNNTPFSPATFRVPPAPYWDPLSMTPEQQLILSSDIWAYQDLISEEYYLQNQTPGDLYYPDAGSGNLRTRGSQNLTDFPVKTCHYFNKGFCKHGSSCRYLHGSDNFSPFCSPNDELGSPDHVFSPSSLEKLELEISELLKSKRGNPVSIASLPMLYYEVYGRNLQADGYLTESQRHGRAGYNLTKLLAQFKRIQLIDRPHGQHAVILAEDASRYNVDNRSERNDLGPIASESRRIFITFPAKSTFTEEDVSDYFNSFGAVEDVRIPSQQSRMFGFVTFASANTVKIVLARGNPHFVCRSHVLVKPYRQKWRLVGRKHMEKNDRSVYYPGNYSELEPDFHSMPRFEAPRFRRRQLMEEQEQALEMEKRRLSELQLGLEIAQHQQLVGYGMEELNALEDPSRLHYVLDVVNNTSVSHDRSKHRGTDYSDQERKQGINLPENPFASR